MRSATSVYRVFAAYYRPVPRNSASARDLSALRPYRHARARATVITFTYCRLTTYHVGSWDPRLLHRTQRQIRARRDREAGLRESRGKKERRDEKEEQRERERERERESEIDEVEGRAITGVRIHYGKRAETFTRKRNISVVIRASSIRAATSLPPPRRGRADRDYARMLRGHICLRYQVSTTPRSA